MPRTSIIHLLLASLGALVLAPSTALAYVDPSAGSMMLQLLLGGLTGVGIAARLLWGRFRAFRSRTRGLPAGPEASPETPRGI